MRRGLHRAASFPSVTVKIKNPEFTQCWHQCPKCRKDWFHQMLNSQNVSPDLYYRKCSSCSQET
jgi:hypothetical protein